MNWSTTLPLGRRLEGESAIVTGAGGGIGGASALRFAREGASVLCADLDLTKAEQIAEQIRQEGGHAIAAAVDISKVDDCEAMAQDARDAFGGIDVLFANAGIGGSSSAQEASVELWQRVLDVNLTGTWLSIRAVLPTMREGGRGSIVIQSSLTALLGFPGTAPYTATKGALSALTRQINADYIGEGIRTNAICPGTVDTELTRETAIRGAEASGESVEKELSALSDGYPIGRIASADEIAAVAAFLASRDSAFVCGTEIVVDGGLLSSLR